MEKIDSMIEQYRQELLDFSKQNGTVSDPATDADADIAKEEPAMDTDQESEQEQKQDVIPVQAAAKPAPRAAEPEPSNTSIEITAGAPFGNPNREKFATYEDFLQKNPQTGTLRVQVYATDQAYPIGNARVTVLLELQNGAREMFIGLTDTDGIIASIPLPAPDVSMSLAPSVSEYLPYSQYTTIVEHPNYVSAKYTGVPIFAGVESIQGVEMIPLVSQGNTPFPAEIYGDEQFARLKGEAG